MALTKKGNLAFGIGASGITDPAVSTISAVQSVEVSSEYTTNVSAKGSDGETAGHVYGDVKNSIRVEGFGTAAAVPTLGASVTVLGKTGAVMRSQVQGSNEDFVKMSVEAEGFGTLSY